MTYFDDFTGGNYWTRRRGTRRHFIGGASALAVGAAGAALAGCGDDDDGDAGGGPSSTSTSTSTSGASPADAGAPVTGGTLVIPVTTQPPDMDPTKTLSAGLHTMVTPVYSKVVRTVLPGEASSAADFTVTPDLAEEWEQVDLQTYTFKLQEGIKWHNIAPLNGRVLVASDIANAITTMAAGGAHASAFDLVDAVETPDDLTLTVKLKAPFALFLDALSNATRQIFAPEAAERPEGLAGTPVIGSGAFMFERFDRGTKFTAVRNPDFFRPGFPYLDGYELLLIPDAATRLANFRSGNAHGLGVTWSESRAALDSNPDTVHEEIQAQVTIITTLMNHTKEPFSDPRVRRAMSMASDRDATVASVHDGHGITGWCIPWSFVQEAPWTPEQLGPWHRYDVAEAKKLMEAAGLEDGLKSTYFYYPYTAAHESQAQLFQAELKANINVELELQPLDYATYFNRVQAQEYDGMCYGYQIGSSASVDDFLYKNMRSGSPANYFFCNDPEIDTRVDKIRAEPDAEERKKLIREVFAIDHEMMYRIHSPAGNGQMLASPKFQGWSPNRVFRTSLGYGTDSFEQSWLRA